MRVPMLAADQWSMHIPKIIAQEMKKIEPINSHVTSLKLEVTGASEVLRVETIYYLLAGP